MKKIITLLLLLCTGVAFGQPRAKIYMEPVTPYMLSTNSTFTADSTVATGLKIVAQGTYVYVSVKNWGDNTAIASATWTLLSKPAGSGANITPITTINWWAKFLADSSGTYTVKVSMTAGTTTKDTTMDIVASKFVGVGNFEGIVASYPQCMSCHSSMPAFLAIFDKWKVSGHAKIFKYEIDSGAAYYGTSCMKCHTTGYDHNKYTNNNGFDDVAKQLGWVWSQHSPPHPKNWDTLKMNYPGLVNFATIGCENCHGAGRQHGTAGDTTKIDINYGAGVCASCHDEPWRHNIYRMYSNSLHSNVLFEGRTVVDSLRFTTASDCNRCHDGESYIQYTKNYKGPLNSTKANQEMITCQTCHDPHGNTNEYSLRKPSTNSDTLGSGESYSSLGAGRICVDCHKSRRTAKTYVIPNVSSANWGPHGSTQGDVLMGKNAATFSGLPPYISGSHKNIPGGCTGCHMAPTTDTGTVTRDKVGGHSMTLKYTATNYDHVTGCVGCHPGVTSFEDFEAPQDFDNNGLTESWQKEVAGCIKNLRIALPPRGIDSVNWQLVRNDSNNANTRKAYYNYQYINNDKSLGMHNPFYVISVLLNSIATQVGISENPGIVPNKYELNQNYPNPFNPITRINFSVPEITNVTLKVFDINGKEITTLVNQKLSTGNFTVTFDASLLSSGVYFYRLTAGKFVETKKMVLLK